MATRANLNTDEIRTEIDFFKGARGKLAMAGATLKLPVYLETDARYSPKLSHADWSRK